MNLEQTFSGWTAPSSDTEQDKQERTERMIREAVDAHAPFKNCTLSVYAKGSYANNTNVRSDSDVDIAVECREAEYWEESQPGVHKPTGTYSGIWTPAKLRSELNAALKSTFPGQVDTSESTAIQVNSSSARVDGDIVPCFSYRYYLSPSQSRPGTKIFPTNGKSIVNYPAQQLDNGRAKNQRTHYAFKKAVRLLKRVENTMVVARAFRELPSYFMECLAYNCPDPTFEHSTWTDTLRAMLAHIWTFLQGDEPAEPAARWLEVNECLYLFGSAQKWTRADGREFAQAAWNHLGFKS